MSLASHHVFTFWPLLRQISTRSFHMRQPLKQKQFVVLINIANITFILLPQKIFR